MNVERFAPRGLAATLALAALPPVSFVMLILSATASSRRFWALWPHPRP